MMHRVAHPVMQGGWQGTGQGRERGNRGGRLRAPDYIARNSGGRAALAAPHTGVAPAAGRA
eukprot:5470779-Alexandrium_andersonii.AAC.1